MFINKFSKFSKISKKLFTEASNLKKTALHSYHKDVLKAKMVGFAGYDMPVIYSGIIDEHDHCRQHAGLFDVSHMGQVK